MKQVSLLLILLLSLSGLNGSCQKKLPASQLPGWYNTTNEQGHPLLGVFENHLPCSDCSRLKFALAIYKDPATGLPSTYVMARVYVAKSEDRETNTGIITMTQGTKTDPDAVVYKLDNNAPGEFRSFWKLSDDILFVLDSDMGPRVGTAGYGYALNKVN